MTTPYAAVNQTSFFDLFGSQAKAIGFQELAAGVHYRISQPNAGGIVAWECLITDVRGGLNRVNGDFNLDSDRLAFCTSADGRHPRTLCLQLLLTNASSPDPSGNLDGLHHVNYNSLLYKGVGGGTDVSLIKENSATDPTPTAITYNPTNSADIISMAKLSSNLGGILVGLSGERSQRHVTVGTTAQTLHANFTSMYGAIDTPLGHVLLYGLHSTHGEGIFTVSTTDTTTLVADPALATKPISLGGFAVGIQRIPGSFDRAYFVIPDVGTSDGSSTASMLRFGAEKQGVLMSFDLEGKDPQTHTIPDLKGVLQCAPMLDGFAVSDGEQLGFWNGDVWKNAFAFRERYPNSDREYRIRGLKPIGNTVIYEVNWIASPSGSGNTQTWLESWNIDTNEIHTCSGIAALSSTGVFGVLSAGAMPLSEQNRFLHRYSDGSWRRIKMLRPGENPYYMSRQTTGAGSSTGDEFHTGETSVALPKMDIPGLWGYPKWCTEIVFLGDVQSAGTTTVAGYVAWGLLDDDANIMRQVKWSAQTTAPTIRNHVWRDEQNAPIGPFYRLWPHTNFKQATGTTRFTPNALPVLYRGVCAMDSTIATWAEVQSKLATA